MGKRWRKQQRGAAAEGEMAEKVIGREITHDDLLVILACMEHVGSKKDEELEKEGWDFSISQEDVQWLYYALQQFEEQVDKEIAKRISKIDRSLKNKEWEEMKAL